MGLVIRVTLVSLGGKCGCGGPRASGEGGQEQRWGQVSGGFHWGLMHCSVRVACEQTSMYACSWDTLGSGTLSWAGGIGQAPLFSSLLKRLASVHLLFKQQVSQAFRKVVSSLLPMLLIRLLFSEHRRLWACSWESWGPALAQCSSWHLVTGTWAELASRAGVGL